MNDEPLFKDDDLQLIESLVYDPTLKPTYENRSRMLNLAG